MANDMTPRNRVLARIEELLAMEAKATPGDWKHVPSGTFTEGEPGHEETHPYPNHVTCMRIDEQGRRCTMFIATYESTAIDNGANAKLIATLRNIMPGLLELLRDGLECERCGSSGMVALNLAFSKLCPSCTPRIAKLAEILGVNNA